MTSTKRDQSEQILGKSVVSAEAALPLYMRIRDDIRARIVEGELKPHDQLPSESELISHYRVSRITVRQALGDLQKAGLIYKLHGKGSFVSMPRAEQSLKRLQGFAEAMGEAGHEIVNKVLSLTEIIPDPSIAARLALPAGSPVTEIRRLRYLNRTPLSVDITYVPTAIGVQLAKADLENRDIFIILENDLAIPLGTAELAIGSVAADAETARLLGLSTGAPLLRIERLTHSADGRPIDFEFLFYVGDAFQYRLSIGRN